MLAAEQARDDALIGHVNPHLAAHLAEVLGGILSVIVRDALGELSAYKSRERLRLIFWKIVVGTVGSNHVDAFASKESSFPDFGFTVICNRRIPFFGFRSNAELVVGVVLEVS